jgi:hypothetical protein
MRKTLNSSKRFFQGNQTIGMTRGKYAMVGNFGLIPKAIPKAKGQK